MSKEIKYFKYWSDANCEVEGSKYFDDYDEAIRHVKENLPNEGTREQDSNWSLSESLSPMFNSCTLEQLESVINKEYKKGIQPWELDFASIIADFNDINLNVVLVGVCRVQYELDEDTKLYRVDDFFMNYLELDKFIEIRTLKEIYKDELDNECDDTDLSFTEWLLAKGYSRKEIGIIISHFTDVEMILSRLHPTFNPELSQFQNINYQDSQDFKNTALHKAVGKNTIEAVSKLLKTGANINIENSMGKTPMDLVTDKTASPIIEMLKKAEEVYVL